MKLTQINNLSVIAISSLMCSLPVFSQKKNAVSGENQKRPNILFVISDDQSYPYASVYGNNTCKTPAFDQVAQSGVLFNRAYVTSPGSSPSRASILTGRYPWQNEEAGTHDSRFQTKYVSFPVILEKAGYHVGYTGKGWGPGNHDGWPYNPAGPEYNSAELIPPYTGISNCDYATNFELFLQQKEDAQPFCFWFGCWEPHRRFEQDSYKKEGLNLDNALVPGYLPDNQVVRGDILDYAVEVEWYDTQLGKILKKLEEIGELDNTFIIVTSDNGMAFPRAKANCYDAGIHVPLAICWGKNILQGKVIDQTVSSVDFAPTILDVAGVSPNGMQTMAGESMIPLLKGKGKKDKNAAVYACRERHSSSRYDNWGYPQRVIINENFLYVRNLHPERYPAGDPLFMLPDKQGRLDIAYFDIDASPTKSYIIENSTDPDVAPFFTAAMDKRPYDELYDLKKDPYCMNNLADDSKHKKMLDAMRKQLDRKLKETGDTRVTGNDPEVWETYPRFSKMRQYPAPGTNK